MSNEMESTRISAFRRTGCLITALPQQQLDSEIKPQTMPTASFSVPIERKDTEDNRVHQEPMPVDDEVGALADETQMLEEEGEEGEGIAELDQEGDIAGNNEVELEDDNGDAIDDDKEDTDSTEVGPSEATKYRRIAAKVNYLSLDEWI